MSYINKSAAMSVCNTQRAYSTMQIIQDLPCAKVIDRETFNKVADALGDTVMDEMDRIAISDFVNRLEEKLFGEVEHWQGYGRTITAPKGTFDKIFNDEEGEE